MKERTGNSRSSSKSQLQVQSDCNSGSNTPRGGDTPNQNHRQPKSRSSRNTLETPDFKTPLPGSRQEKHGQQRSSTVNDKRPTTQGKLNTSNVEADDGIEEEPLPTLEDKRKEIIKKYHNELRARAREFVAERQSGPRRLQQPPSEVGDNEALKAETSKCLSAMETEQKPTTFPSAAEAKDELKSTKLVPTEENLPTIEEAKDELKSTTLATTEENVSVVDTRTVGDKEDVCEMEREAESGIVMDDDDDEEEDSEPELTPVEKQALHEAVWDGQIDLLDDLLDIPGANMEVLWFGENLLMTAIRAGQTEISAYLVDNGVNVNFNVTRFEKREDMVVEIEKRTAEALERELEEQKNKKKKKKAKEKDKEKLALEQLEKDMEEKVQINTPEPNPSSALTDLDFFLVSCRDMAVECGQPDVVDLIDENNGQLWPESMVTRKKRQIKLKQDILEKLVVRDDWIHTDDELDSEDEHLNDSLPLGKTNSIKSRSNSKNNLDKTGFRTSTNSVADNSRSQQKIVSRQQKGRVSQNDNLKAPASREKFADISGITVAGETEAGSPSPLPLEVPVEFICHCPDEGPKQTRYPYRGTRSFLSRKAANEKYKDLFEEESIQQSGLSKRQYVKSHGSFMSESQAWVPKPSPKKRNATSLSNSDDRKKPQRGYIKIVDSYYSDQLKYEHRRSVSTRKVSPWTEDDPVMLSNLMKRSKSQLIYPSVKTNRPSTTRERSDLSNTSDGLRRTASNSSFNGAIRTNSKLYDGVSKNYRKSRTVPSTPTKEMRETRSSSNLNRVKIVQPPENILRQKSDISHNRHKSESSLAPSRSSYNKQKRYSKTSHTQSLMSLLDGKSQTSNHYTTPPENVWAQRCLTVNKYNQIRRYSPAGYLKGGHSKEELEHLNLITLQQNQKKDHMTVVNCVS